MPGPSGTPPQRCPLPVPYPRGPARTPGSPRGSVWRPTRARGLQGTRLPSETGRDAGDHWPDLGVQGPWTYAHQVSGRLSSGGASATGPSNRGSLVRGAVLVPARRRWLHAADKACGVAKRRGTWRSLTPGATAVPLPRWRARWRGGVRQVCLRPQPRAQANQGGSRACRQRWPPHRGSRLGDRLRASGEGPLWALRGVWEAGRKKSMHWWGRKGEKKRAAQRECPVAGNSSAGSREPGGREHRGLAGGCSLALQRGRSHVGRGSLRPCCVLREKPFSSDRWPERIAG